MNNTEKVREQIAKTVGEWTWKDNFDGIYVTESDRTRCRKVANQILAIPGLRVEADDQSLPETLIDELEYGESTCTDFRWGVAAAQKDMLTAGFVKCEPRENHQ